MPRTIWPIFFAVCINLSCANGPQLNVCVSDVKSNGFQCYDEHTHKKSFLPYENSDNYVALSPTDTQTLVTYCAKPKKLSISRYETERLIRKIKQTETDSGGSL